MIPKSADRPKNHLKAAALTVLPTPPLTPTIFHRSIINVGSYSRGSRKTVSNLRITNQNCLNPQFRSTCSSFLIKVEAACQYVISQLTDKWLGTETALVKMIYSVQLTVVNWLYSAYWISGQSLLSQQSSQQLSFQPSVCPPLSSSYQSVTSSLPVQLTDTHATDFRNVHGGRTLGFNDNHWITDVNVFDLCLGDVQTFTRCSLKVWQLHLWLMYLRKGKLWRHLCYICTFFVVLFIYLAGKVSNLKFLI